MQRLRKPEIPLHLGAGTDLAKCPRCYTYIPVDAALRASVNGFTMHFCSPECLEAYRRDRQDVDAYALVEESPKMQGRP